MNKNITIVAISLYVLSAIAATPAFAISLPDFGSCVNPQGSVVANYSSGTHGIVGQSQEVLGSDSVYKSSGNGVTQCFCPDNGQGIQTNWLKADKLSLSDIDVLKNQGWTYIATGYSWGLEDKPYLAKNSNYACNNTAKNSTSNVLSLANTGDSQTIYTLVLSGAAFLISGLILRRFSK